MAYLFNKDLQEVRRLMDWIERRIDALKDHRQLPLLVRLVRGNLEDLHDRFHTNPFQNRMVEEAKTFTHVVLNGVGDSICSNPKEIFVAQNATKVGKELEGVLYYTLCEDYGALDFGTELFYILPQSRFLQYFQDLPKVRLLV